ncbi:MAG TPA: ABC transporter permease [Candidatus Methylomirabilis sp.]|nr:ABC transporter permease [Candidatus Methylomirabilis sp.]
MDVREAFALALEMLAANRVRTALTMLGVVIGVAAIILLVSLGEGATAYITRELTGLGTNLLIITPGKTQTTGGLHPPAGSTVRKLTYEDAVALRRRAALLTDAVPIVLGTGKVRYLGASRDTSVIGVTPEFQRVRQLYVEIGQFVSDEDVEGRRRVAVLGRTVKRELFGEENPLGQFVTLADSRYRVIGIMEKKGMSLGFDIDDLVFIPVKSAQDLFDTDRLFEILASVRSPDEIDRAIRQVKDLLIRRHGNREDFTVTSQGAILSAFTTILKILTAVLGGIAGISLLVGGIGIMNIMLVSVRERTREIGIRKAVGARRRDILGQFLLESVVMSSLGGGLGILAGIGGAKALSLFFTYLPTHVSPWSVLMAFGFSAAVGIFFGVYPARRAALLDPIQALRYE